MTRRLTAVDLLRERLDALENKLAASEALLEGMTTEAKRHSERAEKLEAERILWARGSLRDGEKCDALLGNAGLLEAEHEELEVRRQRELAKATITISGLEYDLARALALLMFGDRPVNVFDRVGALFHLRTGGLPWASLHDLDAACEGLETPWGSGSRASSGPALKWVPTTEGTHVCLTVLEDLVEGWRDAAVYYEGGQLVTEKDGVGESVGNFTWLHPDFISEVE